MSSSPSAAVVSDYAHREETREDRRLGEPQAEGKIFLGSLCGR